MAKPKYTHSGMPNALVLSGTAGALAALLDAGLTTGAGLKSVVSLVVAGGIATATVAGGHSLAPDVTAIVAGATPSGHNGEHVVTATGANTISWPTALPDGAATGTITIKLAPAGWASPYTGTNLRTYKPTVIEATGMLLRLDDTGTTNARALAYEAMTDVSTGAGLVPLGAQVSGGLYWSKSSAASALARTWFMVADDRGFYLAVAPAGGDRYTVFYCGDLKSLKSGDAYGHVITGNTVNQTAVSTVPDGCVGYSNRGAGVGAYLARSHTGIGQAQPAQNVGAHHNGTAAASYAGTAGYSLGTYPNGPNNGLLTGELEVYAMGVRGTFPGLLHPVQDLGNAFVSGAVIDGTDDLLGHRLLAIRTAPPAGSIVAGTVFIDLTGPWER